MKTLTVDNVVVMDASAENLPYPDNSFDMVFSSHVIEHVPDVNKAISEINRVLKPGGLNICIVPTTTSRVYAFFDFYMYLLQRSCIKLFRMVFPSAKQTTSIGEEQNKKTFTETTSAYLKDFPFPPPHGVLKNYLSEVKNWTLSNWRKTVTKSGDIKLISQYGLQLNPVLSLSGVFFPVTGVKIYKLTRLMENKLSGVPFFKQCGISTMIITEKE